MGIIECRCICWECSQSIQGSEHKGLRGLSKDFRQQREILFVQDNLLLSMEKWLLTEVSWLLEVHSRIFCVTLSSCLRGHVGKLFKLVLE